MLEEIEQRLEEPGKDHHPRVFVDEQIALHHAQRAPATDGSACESPYSCVRRHRSLCQQPPRERPHRAAAPTAISATR